MQTILAASSQLSGAIALAITHNFRIAPTAPKAVNKVAIQSNTLLFGSMHMPYPNGHYLIPNQVIDLIVSTATHFGGETVVDPWFHEPAILRRLAFAQKRTGFVPTETLWRQLVHEEPQLKLQKNNVFDSEITDKFDLVLWGPPWKPMVEWQGRTHRVEAFLLHRAVELLAPGGVAVCLIPSNLLSAPLWSASRRRILHEFALEMTVELPQELFAPVLIQSALVVIRQRSSKSTVYLAEYHSDHDVLLANLEQGSGQFHVPQSSIRDRWDRSYHDPRCRAVIETHLREFPVRTISELADVIPGLIRHEELVSETGEYLLVTGATLNRGTINSNADGRRLHVADNPRVARQILREGDILVSRIKPQVYVYRGNDPPAIAGNSVIIIRPTNGDYLAAYLATDDGRSLFAAQVEMKGGRLGGHTRISIVQVGQFQIPIIPLSQPELLVKGNLLRATRSELKQLSDELLSARHENLLLRQQLEREEARHADTQARTAAVQRKWQQSGVTQAFIELHFASVHERLAQISSTVDEVSRSIKSEFSSTKQSARSIEEKLIRMRGSLDRVAAQISADTEKCSMSEEIVRTWLAEWDDLEPKSQTFLISGEHLFDLIDESGAEDWSPFVLQYCRALENELLARVFCAYHDDFHRRVSNVEGFLDADMQLDNVKPFARAIKRDSRDHTLGTMARILGMSRPGGNTIEASALLKDFSQFVADNFGSLPTSKEFTSQLEIVTTKYRNRAAHPDVIDANTATECQRVVRTILPSLVQSYNHRPTTNLGMTVR